MDKLAKKMNITLPPKRKSFSGKMTYELPSFHAKISGLQEVRKHQEVSTTLSSQSFNLKWAKGHLDILSRDNDYASVVIILTDPNRDYGQWLWSLTCSISISNDIKTLFQSSNNISGLTAWPCYGNTVTDMDLRFSKKGFVTAAKACGNGSTFTIIVQFEAIGFDQGAARPQYKKKPGNPCGILANPALIKALHLGTESDFIIFCKGREYPVHRTVLKWASPVFCRMLETPMLEASSNKLVITDMDCKTVQMMVDFIYKARINVMLDDDAINLLYCADKYELVALTEHCLQHMKGIVSDTNVIELLSSAIKCNAGEVVKELVGWCKKRFWELYRKNEFRAFVEANLKVFYGEQELAIFQALGVYSYPFP